MKYLLILPGVLVLLVPSSGRSFPRGKPPAISRRRPMRPKRCGWPGSSLK